MALSLPNNNLIPPIPSELGTDLLSNNSGSLEIEIDMDLSKILSLAGIELPSIPPTGSFPPLPKKIKFLEVNGVVVNALTKEPLSDVKVTNSFLKKSRTNKKGEFTIKHPDLLGTGLNPTKFPLNFKLKKHSPLKLTPYASTGDLKPNLGIVQLKPFESNLKEEIIALFAFPPDAVRTYATMNVTFDFKIQKKLDLSIADLKSIVIPILLGLIAKYGVNEVEKLIEKIKNDKAKAFEEIKDIISCPPQEDIARILSIKNALANPIEKILKVIDSTLKTISTSQKILSITDIALKIAEEIPLPTSTPPGVGIPINTITKIQKTITKLSNIITKALVVNSALLAILTLLKLVLTQVLNILNLLDLLIQFCATGSTGDQVSLSSNQMALELTNLTIDQSNNNTPIVTNVNGFTMGVETEPQISTLSIKRRRAIATNKQGVVMLTGEWSFSSIDQILINELVFYIQTNDLRAD